MNRPHVQEFVNYALAEAAPRPLLKTEAHLSQVHLFPHFKPMWVNRTPYGFVLLYPDWLAFLTDSPIQPGWVPDKMMSADMLRSIAHSYKYAMRLQSIGSVVRMAYAGLTTSQRDGLKTLIANPNSVFVPLSTITSVHQQRDYGVVVSLCVRTSDGRDLRFAPNVQAALPGPRYWKAMNAAFGARWEPKLQAALHDAVARNEKGRV